MWLVSVDRPLIPLYFRWFKQNKIKGPRPFKQQKNVFERFNNPQCNLKNSLTNFQFAMVKNDAVIKDDFTKKLCMNAGRGGRK